MSDDYVPADITPYLNLLTSEHNQKPNFVATVSAQLQPIADILQTLGGMTQAFDLDTAVFPQLDVDGQWIGASRVLGIPLVGVYFSWGTTGLGWGQGTWQGPFAPVDGLVVLGDDDYRNYLKATILANVWDGSIPELYTILDMLFGGITGSYQILDDGDPLATTAPPGEKATQQPPLPIQDDEGFYIGDVPTGRVLIQDNGDMTFYVMITGEVNPIPLALLVQGYLKVKPAGVQMIVIVPSAAPVVFGWASPPDPDTGEQVQPHATGGWGVGSWPTVLAVL